MQKQSVQSEAKIQEIIHSECLRKDKLLEFLVELESKESRVKALKNEKKYSRMYRGTAIVTKIDSSQLLITKPSGKQIGFLAINDDVSKFVKLHDQLEVVLGLRGNHWRIVLIICIASQLPDLDGLS